MTIKELYTIYREHPQVTTDSRDCPAGSIFIALKGASFDGNKFAASALDKGCSYAVVDEPQYAVAGDDRYIVVDDCLTTYKELAREHRRQFSIPVIGITGTNGKTTTKELVSAVLARRYRVMHTEGNYNNDVGVPKTLLRLTKDDEMAVVEMGASHPGDIRRLVEYVEPTAGLITNVGRAHLQGFGSFEGVMRTKGELYDFLKAHGALLFLNEANPHLRQMAEERGMMTQPLVSYGQSDDREAYNVTGQVVACAPYLQLRWAQKGTGESHTVQTHLIGAYNIDNCLAAVAVGLHYGVSADDICQALESYEPTNNRSELLKTADNVLVVDAYNANPTSMAAAISSFKQLDMPQPKMLILGDMRELGEVSQAEHQKVVDSVKDMGFGDVWLVGPEFGKTTTAYRKFADVEAVKAAIHDDKPRGHCILVKGSNGIRLFELTKEL